MESPRVTIRLPKRLHDAARKSAAAAGVEISEWIRRLVEEATGIKVEVKEGGLTHASKKRRREIASMGGKARAARAKAESSSETQ